MESEPGGLFADIPNICIVYISEFDFLGYGKTLYHIDKVIRETGTAIDDGLQEIFVNTCVDDGSDIAELMRCFIQKDVNNPKFPVFSSRVNRFKNTEGGLHSMCELMERYMAEGKAEALAQGKVEGEQTLMSLYCYLKGNNMADEAEKIMSDREFYHQMLETYRDMI